MEERGSIGATLTGLREAEYELAFFTESARTYWRMWGPLGEPMVKSLDSWADLQQGYLQRVKDATRTDGRA